VLHATREAGTDVTAEELAEKLTIYALSITMETIRRESGIEMTTPTLDNLLSIDRIIQFGKINPDFGRFLKGACIAPESTPPTEESWLQRLKTKILSRITES
jgi:hypothetical protein